MYTCIITRETKTLFQRLCLYIYRYMLYSCNGQNVNLRSKDICFTINYTNSGPASPHEVVRYFYEYITTTKRLQTKLNILYRSC